MNSSVPLMSPVGKVLKGDGIVLKLHFAGKEGAGDWTVGFHLETGHTGGGQIGVERLREPKVH